MIMANEDWTSSKRQQISAERKDTSKMRLGKEMTSFFMRKSDAGEKGAPQVQNHVRFSGLGNWVYKAKTRRQKKKKKKKESTKQSCGQSPTQLSDSKAAAAHAVATERMTKKQTRLLQLYGHISSSSMTLNKKKNCSPTVLH